MLRIQKESATGRKFFHLRGTFLKFTWFLLFHLAADEPCGGLRDLDFRIAHTRAIFLAQQRDRPDGLPFDQNRRDDLCSIGRGILISCITRSNSGLRLLSCNSLRAVPEAEIT